MDVISDLCQVGVVVQVLLGVEAGGGLPALIHPVITPVLGSSLLSTCYPVNMVSCHMSHANMSPCHMLHVTLHVLMPHHLGVEVVVLQVWVGVQVEVGVKHRRVVILTALACH